jgi:hypothetical protein
LDATTINGRGARGVTTRAATADACATGLRAGRRFEALRGNDFAAVTLRGLALLLAAFVGAAFRGVVLVGAD